MAAPDMAGEHMPCHEAPADQAPAEPASSHDDCGCGGDSYEALVQSADKNLGQADSSAIVFRAPLPQVVQTTRAAFRRAPQETDLPPPDILLLKSTLLI